jgi:hypothetical protein
MYGRNKNVCKTFVRTPVGKRSLGRIRHRWHDDTKMYHKAIWWDNVDCINLAYNRNPWQTSAKMVMRCHIP